MPKKPSKNSKCPCGSGKKYRKCHGKEARLLAEVTKIFKEQEQARVAFAEKHGHARPPMSVKMGDKRMVVVGGSIYQQIQEGPYNFVNVVHDCGLEIFGIPYLEQQEQLPLEERHPALQWMYTFVDHDEQVRSRGIADPKVRQIGAGSAWIRFGYDLFTVRDNAELHARLAERLVSAKDFQGARHELAVAALCIAAGFDLRFEDEGNNRVRHPEFIGTDKKTGMKIAVEAKSRHRRGVKGFASGKDIAPGEEVGIRGLVLDGFGNIESSAFPSYIFVDVNLPPAPDDEAYQRWMQEIDQTMEDLWVEGYADPCPANAVFFMNDPSHYLQKEQIGLARDSLWFKHFVADTARIEHPAQDMKERFASAFRARVAPPSEFPTFQ